MKCPICNAHTVVIDTRGDKRRRECFNQHRFSTLEALVVERQQNDDVAAIQAATGTLRQIAARFNRSVYYVWQKRKAAA